MGDNLKDRYGGFVRKVAGNLAANRGTKLSDDLMLRFSLNTACKDDHWWAAATRSLWILYLGSSPNQTVGLGVFESPSPADY